MTLCTPCYDYEFVQYGRLKVRQTTVRSLTRVSTTRITCLPVLRRVELIGTNRPRQSSTQPPRQSIGSFGHYHLTNPIIMAISCGITPLEAGIPPGPSRPPRTFARIARATPKARPSRPRSLHCRCIESTLAVRHKLRNRRADDVTGTSPTPLPRTSTRLAHPVASGTKICGDGTVKLAHLSWFDELFSSVTFGKSCNGSVSFAMFFPFRTIVNRKSSKLSRLCRARITSIAMSFAYFLDPNDRMRRMCVRKAIGLR